MKNGGQRKRKNFIILATIVGIVLIAFGVATYSSAEHDRIIRNDELRFIKANEKKHRVFNRVVQRIGAPLKTEEKNICYNSEQGPFDDGKLWCQVASAAYFSNEIPESEVSSRFIEALYASGVEPKTPGQTWFDGANDLTCRLEILSGRFADAPGYYFSGFPDSQQTMIVRCVDRAKAKHYPYMD